MRKIFLGVPIVLLGLSWLILPKKDAPKKHNQSTIVSVDPTLVESMASLKTTHNNQLLPWSADDGIVSLAQIYEQELEKKENALWQQAQRQFGISRTTFNTKVKNKQYAFTNKQAQRSASLSQEVIVFVEDILQKCGFDPKTIKILANRDAGTSPAGAISTTMFIYQPAFEKLDRRAFSYIVAHEAMHIKHQDSIERMVLKSMLAQDGNLTELQERFIDNYTRFQETRADIHAILIDPLFAEGGVVYFDHLVTKSNTLTTVHPKSQDRLQLCSTVFNAWNLIPTVVS